MKRRRWTALTAVLGLLFCQSAGVAQETDSHEFLAGCARNAEDFEVMLTFWIRQNVEASREGEVTTYDRLTLPVLGATPIGATSLHSLVGNRLRSVSYRLPGGFDSYVAAARASFDQTCSVGGRCAYSTTSGSIGSLESVMMQSIGDQVHLVCNYRIAQ